MKCFSPLKQIGNFKVDDANKTRIALRLSGFQLLPRTGLENYPEGEKVFPFSLDGGKNHPN
jgi:hypothetical protein